jgi:hypothetical protein
MEEIKRDGFLSEDEGNLSELVWGRRLNRSEEL